MVSTAVYILYTHNIFTACFVNLTVFFFTVYPPHSSCMGICTLRGSPYSYQPRQLPLFAVFCRICPLFSLECYIVTVPVAMAAGDQICFALQRGTLSYSTGLSFPLSELLPLMCVLSFIDSLWNHLLQSNPRCLVLIRFVLFLWLTIFVSMMKQCCHGVVGIGVRQTSLQLVLLMLSKHAYTFNWYRTHIGHIQF